jgi:hypothetical protein
MIARPVRLTPRAFSAPLFGIGLNAWRGQADPAPVANALLRYFDNQRAGLSGNSDRWSADAGFLNLSQVGSIEFTTKLRSA